MLNEVGREQPREAGVDQNKAAGSEQQVGTGKSVNAKTHTRTEIPPSKEDREQQRGASGATTAPG